MGTTDEKGKIGLGQVIADLISGGFDVAIPITEHLPYDLIASNSQCLLKRIQVRYSARITNGALEVPLRSTYHSDCRQQSKPLDWTKVDVVAVYCPKTEKCYYLVRSDVDTVDSCASLRLDPAKNGRVKGIREAHLFTDPQRIFREL